jgi:hypothetical protein
MTGNLPLGGFDCRRCGTATVPLPLRRAKNMSVREKHPDHRSINRSTLSPVALTPAMAASTIPISPQFSRSRTYEAVWIN